ncbi:peptidoglycan bridge formation glycyltransferase FemA/FemB family protein [Patescibacteria group bacterium]
MSRLISVSLSPNVFKEDLKLAFKLLLSPQRWQKGEAIKALEKALERKFSGSKATTFVSGRTALLAILKALNIGLGDQVLCPSFSCVVVSNSVLEVGAKPVFVDISPQSFNLSLKDLEKKITPACKAIIVQHTFGFPAPMKELLKIAQKNHLIVIEDCAHGIGSRTQGKQIGEFGEAAFFSFGRDKAISSVFGGAVVTQNKSLDRKIRAYQQSLPYPKPSWVAQQLLHPLLFELVLPFYNLGGLGKVWLVIFQKLKVLSFPVTNSEKQGLFPDKMRRRLPNALAKLALSQLKRLPQFNLQRQKMIQLYQRELQSLPITQPVSIHEGRTVPLLRFSILVDDPQSLYQFAKKNNILFNNWYYPAISPPGVDYFRIDYSPQLCPQAELASKRVVNLPVGPNMDEQKVSKVIAIIKRFYSRCGKLGGISAGPENSKKINIIEVDSKEVWEKFVLSSPQATFLQSWSWGQFHQSLGSKVYYLGLAQAGRLLGVALLIKENARRGAYLACPGGPLLDWGKPALFSAFVKRIIKIGLEEGVVFVRIRSPLLDTSQNRQLFKRYRFLKAPMHMHAETTWQLSLQVSAEDLLRGMRKNTRYLVRKSWQEELKIVKSQDPKDIKILYELQLETARRHRFVPFPLKFLETQFSFFARDDQACLFIGKYKGEVLAVAMILFYGKEAVYHYAGSRRLFPKVPIAYRLQWEAIREAQKRGCQIYNFWGIAPEGKRKHRFAGVTTFKKGFGGEQKSYLPAFDLPLKKRYLLTFLFETLRRCRRGL